MTVVIIKHNIPTSIIAKTKNILDFYVSHVI